MTDKITDEDLKIMWRSIGGKFHGPKVETGYMSEAKLLQHLRSVIKLKEYISDSDDNAMEVSRLKMDMRDILFPDGDGPTGPMWCDMVSYVSDLKEQLIESNRKLTDVCMAHGPALIKIHDLEKKIERDNNSWREQCKKLGVKFIPPEGTL